MIKKLFIAAIISFGSLSLSYAQQFIPLVENIQSSFRGITTVKKNIIWISGSNGTVGISNNKGKSWKWVNPKGYKKYDFRDIHAFSEKEAVIMSSGTPSVILYTSDAGKSWKETFRDERKEVFLDDMIFDGKVGYILGDPIDASFQLLKTNNKGKTWKNITADYILFADEGEAAFAASGSNMKLFKDNLYIGTGGKYASFFNYNPKGGKIDKYDVPIWSGENSTGIFAIDFKNKSEGIVVGGNYLMDQDNRNNILLTKDAGQTWSKPLSPILGYRSDVKYITDNIVLATGTSGTDISYDAGYTWKNISTQSFNSIGISADKSTIYLTGSKGNVFLLEL